jgi:hypothetical protein
MTIFLQLVYSQKKHSIYRTGNNNPRKVPRRQKQNYNTFYNFSPLQFLYATVEKVYVFRMENLDFKV